MNRSSFAFLVALLFHLLLFLIIWIMMMYVKQIDIDKKPQEKRFKISLKEMPLKSKQNGITKEKVKPNIIAPPMPKGSQLKKITNKAPIKYEPQNKRIEPKLNAEPAKVTQPQKNFTAIERPFIPLLDKKAPINVDLNETKVTKKEESKKSIFDILSQDMSSNEKEEKKQDTRLAQSINQNIQELYGSEFGKLTPGQQKYILDNQEIMRRITQEVLTRVARVNLPRNLNVNSSNVIEFYLYPNGDISDIKFLKKSDVYVLDDTTKETIEYAYSRYPRPTEKTLIRYNVYYNLARY